MHILTSEYVNENFVENETKLSVFPFAYLVHLEQILSPVHRLHKQITHMKNRRNEEQCFLYRLSDYYRFLSLSAWQSNRTKGLRIYLAKNHIVLVGSALQKS